MKRIYIMAIVVFMLFSLVGCKQLLGESVFKLYGMEFTSQIEMIEECLDVDLEGFRDSHIKTIYSYTDPDGNDLTIKYIDLEGAGDVFEKDIERRDHWNALPYDATIKDLITSSGASEKYGFEYIEDGLYIISGVTFDKNEFDFDDTNLHTWYGINIGIWDSNDETLYFISITDQAR